MSSAPSDVRALVVRSAGTDLMILVRMSDGFRRTDGPGCKDDIRFALRSYEWAPRIARQAPLWQP